MLLTHETMCFQQVSLYVLVLILLSFVGIGALGGGIFNQSEHWLFQWQHLMFRTICHQDPERSFWIGNQPMAVCSRCMGIYTSLWLGWLFLPLNRWNISIDKAKKMLAVIIFLNMIDVAGNMAGVWGNTLYSRLIMGMLLGGATIQLFSGDFFQIKTQSNGDDYARTTTTELRK